MSQRSRRSFLRAASIAGAAGAAGSLFPWLRAVGQPVARVPKLAIIYFPHGTVFDQWRPPSGGETDWTFSHILEPLSAHRDQLAIIDGLRMPDMYPHRVPHSMDGPMVLTGSPCDYMSDLFLHPGHPTAPFGWNTGVSIDHHISARIGGSPLVLGVVNGGAHPGTRISYREVGAWVDPIDTPLQAWNSVFADLVDPDRDVNVIRRRAILDVILDDLASVKPHLSADDRRKLDSHETGIRELEEGLGEQTMTCDVPEQPNNLGLQYDIDQQFDLMANALACGISRVASVQVRVPENDGAPYPWVGIDSGGHHLLSHGRTQPEFDLLGDLYRWYMERLNGFLNRLAQFPDGDGYTLLDNTMVCVVSELGTGWNHDQSNVPYLVAGGAAGRLRGGRYLDLRGSGAQHNRLLVSMANVMGDDAIETYGSWDNASGPVPGLLQPA
ncbi:MAG: DUF1552 domain-containing protein [Sandaracinaceae bacterium]